MSNFFVSPKILSASKLALFIFATFTTSSILRPLASEATKYKKSTVVDFEGALVEGKSRKPYSAYLTQQKENNFSDLHQWEPDFQKIFVDAQEKLDKTR